MVNDGVVDTPKPKEHIFNMISGIQEKWQQEYSKANDSKKSNDSRGKPTWVSKPKCHFTPLGDLYDVVLKTLVANNINKLLDNCRPYETNVKPKWWSDNHYYDYHRNKANKKGKSIKLKHLIQDHIDN